MCSPTYVIGTCEAHLVGYLGMRRPGISTPEISPRCGRRPQAALSEMLVHGEEIRRSEPVDRHLHVARVPLVAQRRVVEQGLSRRHRDHRGVVSARRATPGHHAVRVEPVLMAMRPQPADGGFYILQTGRKDGLAAQPVVDAHHGVATGEAAQERQHLDVTLVPDRKRAAVDVQHYRERTFAGLRQVDVELLGRRGVRVRDVQPLAPDMAHIGGRHLEAIRGGSRERAAGR